MLQPFETMPKQSCKSAVINALKIAVTNRLAEHHFNEALLKNGELVISFVYYLQRCDMETFSLNGTRSAKTGTGKGV